jgi:hypothetical protein
MYSVSSTCNAVRASSSRSATRRCLRRRAPGPVTGRWPQFPDDLQARFGDRRFAPVDPPGFFDYEGTELVLIGVAGELARELGIDLDSEAERLSVGDVFEELRLSRDRQLADPLMKGSGGRPTAGRHAPGR